MYTRVRDPSGDENPFDDKYEMKGEGYFPPHFLGIQPPETLAAAASSEDGGPQENQEDSRKHQQQARSRDEERQVHARLQDRAQEPQKLQGKIDSDFEQLSAAPKIGDRVLCDAFQSQRAPFSWE